MSNTTKAQSANSISDVHLPQAVNGKLLRPLIVALPQGSNILDLGSGSGNILPAGWPAPWAKVLGADGFQVDAVDKDPGVALPWPGVTYFRQPVEDFLAMLDQQKKYQLIIASNISRFIKPADCLRQLPKVLAPGGVIFVRTF